MARLSHALGVAPGASPSADRSVAELTQLLSRLEQTILRANHEQERRLRSSEFERARLNTNLEYARNLLTRLEQETLGIKIQARRSELQANLNRRRELLEQLFDRMHDLEQLHEDGDDDGDDSSEGEDLLGGIIPTPSESMDSRSTGVPTEDTGEDAWGEAAIPEIPPSVPAQTAAQAAETPGPPAPSAPSATAAAAAGTTALPSSDQTIRSRGTNTQPQPQTQSQEDTAFTTARAALFASRRSNNNTPGAAAGSKAPAPPTSTTNATAEAILDHQRAEQDALSDSILKMASALKTSSQRFSNTLEEDKALLSRAGEGMDRTEKGMDSASSRMGALKRMTEGKGWWGRVILYAWVYGLMLVLVLLVFVFPKLRF